MASLSQAVLENGLPVCQDSSVRIGAFQIHEPVPQLRTPHAFVMIRPWIDVGSAVSVAMGLLESHFGAKELGKLDRPGTFFDFTRYRPTITLVEGRREIKVPNSFIHYAITDDGPDLMFLRLQEPHAFGEDYADSILEVLKHFGISRYCRLGAMYDAVPHTRPLLVTGNTGGVPAKRGAGDLLDRRPSYQGPTTIMNLVSDGVPKLEPSVDMMSFMVHLPQYVQLEEDHMGAARLVTALSSFYDLPDDLPPSKRGQEQYGELDRAVDRNSELKNLITRLESQYDAEGAAREQQTAEPAPLAPEVERFLEEMDRRFGEADSANN